MKIDTLHDFIVIGPSKAHATKRAFVAKFKPVKPHVFICGMEIIVHWIYGLTTWEWYHFDTF